VGKAAQFPPLTRNFHLLAEMDKTKKKQVAAVLTAGGHVTSVTDQITVFCWIFSIQ